MSDTKFTPEYIVCNYLPNYGERINEWMQQKPIMSCDFNGEPFVLAKPDKRYFINDNFPEALEHFAKAQREICAEEYKKDELKFGGQFHSYYRTILNAPIPSPKKV